MSTVEEVPARSLVEGDQLADGRVVEAKAFGGSTHDPSLMVWFADGSTHVYYDSHQLVKRQAHNDNQSGQTL